MTFDADDGNANEPEVASVHNVARVGDDTQREVMDRHLSAVGRQLDVYLDAVVRELRMRGVIAASPQRTDPAQRLLGSIVLDCTAVRIDAGNTLGEAISDLQPLGGVVDHPVPVVVTWDEYAGWCVGLHHDSTHSTRRYLDPELLPAPGIVAEFVIALAQGRPVGAAHPLNTSASGGYDYA